MSILDLPMEVISLIVKELAPSLSNPFPTSESSSPENSRKRASSRSILCTLSLACKTLSGDATRLLYASMTEDDVKMHIGFLDAVRNNEHLAALVRCYHSPTMDLNGDGQNYPLRWIRQSLLLMVNLKELAVRPISGWRCEVKVLPGKPRGKPMPFQLHTFTYWTRRLIDNDRGEEGLDFVITQHELKHLRWRYHGKVPRKFADKIPNGLKWLEAPVDSVKSILPGRSIERLRCWTCQDQDVVDIRQMEELRCLKVLSLVPQVALGKEEHMLMGIVDQLCQLSADPFPALEITAKITMIGAQGHVRREVHLDSQELSLVPRLKTLFIQYMDEFFLYDLSPNGNLQETILGTFNKYPTIQNIYLYNICGGQNATYRHWTRENKVALVAAL